MSRGPARHRARIGTGALALALLAPVGAAHATEPVPEQEQDYEGSQEPDAPGNSDDDAGDLTPGQDSTDGLDNEGGPGGPAQDPDEGESEDGPLETEVDGEPVEGPVAAPPPPPPPPATSPSPPARTPPPAAQTPSEFVQPVPAPPTKVAPTRRKPTPQADRRERQTERRGSTRRRRPERVRPTPVSPRVRNAAPIAQGDAAAPARATHSASAGTTSGSTHTVRPGESLWSIAAARLGPGATPAQIAREVERLWNLNAEAIGTGDPSLIAVGTELRLR